MAYIADVGNWREGGGRNMPSAPSTDEDLAAHTPPSTTAPTTASSEDEETPQPPFHPQSQAAVMAHMIRPGMGPAPRMGPGGPMMYGPVIPPFVSSAGILHAFPVGFVYRQPLAVEQQLIM